MDMCLSATICSSVNQAVSKEAAQGTKEIGASSTHISFFVQKKKKKVYTMTQYLSQIIAIEKGAKEKATSALSTARALFGNKGHFSGLSRSYTPYDEEGERLPPESTKIHFTAELVLAETKIALTHMLDTVATKDYTNCHAKADIVVDGVVILAAVPATYILFLEKQLVEIASFIKAIPTLDISEEWHYDKAQDAWATGVTETIRSKKVMRNNVLAAATQYHPAQVQPYTEDIPAGRWKTIKYSGAMQLAEVNEMALRVEKLQKAVKFAREEANRSKVEEQYIGEQLLKFILR
jgi:hypothetical protein